MTPRAFRERLLRRARRSGATLPEAVIPPLHAYFSLLARWSKTINLTALPLDPPTEETFDRLFVEPLAASRHFPSRVSQWADIGSGGGSPALPLRLACDAEQLTMVESKARKAAFLREAVRSVPFEKTSVLNSRVEDIESIGAFDVATVRAVKVSQELEDAISGLLVPDGWLLLFQPAAVGSERRGFYLVDVHPLGTRKTAFLARYRRSFHVEHR